MICLNFKVFLTFSYGFLGATAKCARLSSAPFSGHQGGWEDCQLFCPSSAVGQGGDQNLVGYGRIEKMMHQIRFQGKWLESEEKLCTVYVKHQCDIHFSTLGCTCLQNLPCWWVWWLGSRFQMQPFNQWRLVFSLTGGFGNFQEQPQTAHIRLESWVFYGFLRNACMPGMRECLSRNEFGWRIEVIFPSCPVQWVWMAWMAWMFGGVAGKVACPAASKSF